LTPTGDRPEALALADRWMRSQTFDGEVQWVVVDDGHTPAIAPHGAVMVRREPLTSDPKHTLALNLAAGLDVATGSQLLIIEDDDCYPKDYVRAMLIALVGQHMVAQAPNHYYHLKDRHYGHYGNKRAGSLCCTGLADKGLDHLRAALPGNGKNVDMRLWIHSPGPKLLLRHEEVPRVLGIKGLPGRPGYSSAWSRRPPNDPDLVVFHRWFKKRARYYEPFL
jgi:hypothetical protein